MLSFYQLASINEWNPFLRLDFSFILAFTLGIWLFLLSSSYHRWHVSKGRRWLTNRCSNIMTWGAYNRSVRLEQWWSKGNCRHPRQKFAQTHIWAFCRQVGQFKISMHQLEGSWSNRIFRVKILSISWKMKAPLLMFWLYKSKNMCIHLKL